MASRPSTLRIVLGACGVALLLFGVFRLITEEPVSSLIGLVLWLAAAVLLHDAVLSPVVVGVGAALAHWVPDRARRWTQFVLVAAALVTVIALPPIVKRGSQPPQKALLQQNYLLHWALLVGGLGVLGVVGWLVRVARERGVGSRRR